MPMRWHWLGRWFSHWSWFWAGAGLLLGGIIHITTILALPHLSTNSAWQRLSFNTPANDMQVLPPIEPGLEILPLMAPDVRYALCRYDLERGPVIVRAQLLEPTWSIALYTPRSLNFYAITGADLKGSNVTLILTTAEEGGGSNLPFLKGSGALTVAVPERKGLLLLRAPLRSQAYSPATQAALEQASCRPAQAPAQSAAQLQ